MKVNLSNPKNAKTYSIEIETIPFKGKKMGEIVDLSEIGFEGKAQIMGGSSKEGFPLVPFLDYSDNRKVLLSDGLGFHSRFSGERKRRTVHGRIIGDRISQINLKLIELGKGIDLDEKYGKKVN